MTLDEDKRNIGNVTRKEPLRMGRIKQKAFDLGMSTEEFILSHDPEGDKASNKDSSSDLQRELIELKAEIKALKTLNSQPKPQQNDFLQQAQGFATLMSTFREMVPQTQANDIIAQITALNKLRDEIEPQYENEDVGDVALKELAKHLPDLIKSRSLGVKQGGNEVHDIEIIAKDNSKIHTSTRPPVLTQEGGTMLSDDEIKKYASEIPDMARNAIKSGSVTFEQLKPMAIDQLKQQNIAVSEEDLRKIFDEVKNGSNPRGENSGDNIQADSGTDEKDSGKPTD